MKPRLSLPYAQIGDATMLSRKRHKVTVMNPLPRTHVFLAAGEHGSRQLAENFCLGLIDHPPMGAGYSSAHIISCDWGLRFPILLKRCDHPPKADRSAWDG